MSQKIEIPTWIGTFSCTYTALGVTQLSWPTRLVSTLQHSAEHLTSVPKNWELLRDLLLAYSAGDEVDFSDIPLDLSGVTDFAQRVYDAVREIHYGHTRSYGEIAVRIKKPSAARAVGNALRRNPIALLIPCHRVIGFNETLGGFSGPGSREQKQEILAHERCGRR